MLTGNRTHYASCLCGWEGWYTTPGYGANAKRRHACGVVDYTPKDCDRPHGHGADHYRRCWCRCWPCRVGMLTQHAASGRARAYGRGKYVDAAPAREHVQRLMARGMGRHRIAEASGVNESTILRLTTGHVTNGRKWISKHVERETEARLLAVTYDPADGAQAVSAQATIRRLRALVALGWWPLELARATGYHRDYIYRLLREGRTQVRPGTARRVQAEYRRLVDLPAPVGPYADRARRQAAERGWTPPLRIAGRVVVGTALDMREAS